MVILLCCPLIVVCVCHLCMELYLIRLPYAYIRAHNYYDAHFRISGKRAHVLKVTGSPLINCMYD